MTRILFICHGSICRSPMARFVMRDIVNKAGRSDEFIIESAATSSEELGNPVYPPARAKLAEHGIDCSGYAARRMKTADYDDYDMIIGMDSENLYYMRRLWGDDPEGKFSLMMQYVGYKPGKELPPMESVREVSDPWYTRDFEATWQDVSQGCSGLLEYIDKNV